VPATVTLQIQHPGGTTKSFELTEHDTFLLGRMADCHLCLPDDAHKSPATISCSKHARRKPPCATSAA
jgi:hypothetical protein